MTTIRTGYVITAIQRLYECMIPTPVPIQRIETKGVIAYWKDDNILVFEVDIRDHYSNWKPIID